MPVPLIQTPCCFFSHGLKFLSLQPSFSCLNKHSGGTLSNYLNTDCSNTGLDHSWFTPSPSCVGNALAESQKSFGCFIRDNWAALVAANGEGETTKLVVHSGKYSVKFTQGGLLCMSKWFNLAQDYPITSLTQNFLVDSTYPACASTPPDLTKMGGGAFFALLASQLNLLRDIVMQKDCLTANLPPGTEGNPLDFYM